MRVSVIIPTRNRVRSLGALLESLDVAECPNGATVHLYVVDNGSTDGTGEMLRAKRACAGRYSLTVLQEPTPGKAMALNRALAEAHGDVTIVLDDDVAVEQWCLVKHFEAYQYTEFAAIQGRVLPGKDAEGRTADPQRLREYNIPIIDYGEDYREIRGLTGTNMSFKREVFEKVGFFDPRLGPGASGFSEDTEFSMRIRAADFAIGYTPHAVVYHELNPVRYGRAYNREVEYRKGVSRSLYRHDSILFRVIPNLVVNCFRYCFYRALGWSQKAYKTEGRIMKCWGYLMGKLQQNTKENTAV
jgi:glucosyl-dolichyl phosphate glucuronosyltransferase